MRIKTFYIAASSQEIDRVRSLARRLEDHGWAWFGGWDWTQGFEREHEYSDHILACRAQWDLDGAIGAKLFVVLDGKPSAGRWVELGARLAVCDAAPIVIREEPLVPKDIFYYLCSQMSEAELMKYAKEGS